MNEELASQVEANRLKATHDQLLIEERKAVAQERGVREMERANSVLETALGCIFATLVVIAVFLLLILIRLY